MQVSRWYFLFGLFVDFSKVGSVDGDGDGDGNGDANANGKGRGDSKRSLSFWMLPFVDSNFIFINTNWK